MVATGMQKQKPMVGMCSVSTGPEQGTLGFSFQQGIVTVGAMIRFMGCIELGWQLNLNYMLLYVLEERLLPWSLPSALVSAERLKTGPNCNSVSSS